MPAAVPTMAEFEALAARVAALEGGVTPPPPPPPPPPAAGVLRFQSWRGPGLPRTGDGDPYPSAYTSGDGGVFVPSLVGDGTLLCRHTERIFYAQFNPYNYGRAEGFPPLRSFARDYREDRAAPWEFGRYNRLRFWIRPPADALPVAANGYRNFNVGTYVKDTNGDPYSDEAAPVGHRNGHFYHGCNLYPGRWNLVTLNQHPDHERGESGVDPGVLADPFGEGRTYWDHLTRFYLQAQDATPPGDWLLGPMEFYEETADEDETNVLAVVAAADGDRLFVGWSGPKNILEGVYEVRWAKESLHSAGWDTGIVLGRVSPYGAPGLNAMWLETSAPPGFLGIRLDGSERFTQVNLTGVP